jgi:hypothetical protein
MAKIHIGKRIQEVWKQSGMKGVTFAKTISLDRQMIYNIFKRETIDTGLLERVSKALQYDFFSEYSQRLPIAQDEQMKYVSKKELHLGLGEELAALRRQLAELENKYKLLEELNQLKTEKLNSLEVKRKKSAK